MHTNAIRFLILSMLTIWSWHMSPIFYVTLGTRRSNFLSTIMVSSSFIMYLYSGLVIFLHTQNNVAHECFFSFISIKHCWYTLSYPMIRFYILQVSRHGICYLLYLAHVMDHCHMIWGIILHSNFCRYSSPVIYYARFHNNFVNNPSFLATMLNTKLHL